MLNNETTTLSITDGTYQEYFNNHYDNKISLRKEVQDWLAKFQFKYFVTITFAFNINSKERTNQVKSFLRMLSNEYFNKTERKSGSFINGFCFIEKEGTRTEHYHILIEDSRVFNFKRNRNKDFGKICADKCSRMETFGKPSINTEIGSGKEYGLDVQTIYSDKNKIIEYLNKTVEETGNFSFILPLDKSGFSPSDEQSYYYH